MRNPKFGAELKSVWKTHAINQTSSQTKHSGSSTREAQAIERLIKEAERREDFKAQHGPVKILMKDGVRLDV